jgi:hypothetical protein
MMPDDSFRLPAMDQVELQMEGLKMVDENIAHLEYYLMSAFEVLKHMIDNNLDDHDDDEVDFDEWFFLVLDDI